MRYFQTARQLYNIGDFAEKNLKLGKNRLLQLFQAMNVLLSGTDKMHDLSWRDNRKREFLSSILKGKEYQEFVLSNSKGKEVSEDTIPSKLIADVVIIYYRFLKAVSIDIIDYDTSYRILKKFKKVLAVGTVKKVGDWLHTADFEDEKKEMFESFIKKGLAAIPDDEKRDVFTLTIKDKDQEWEKHKSLSDELNKLYTKKYGQMSPELAQAEIYSRLNERLREMITEMKKKRNAKVPVGNNGGWG